MDKPQYVVMRVCPEMHWHLALGCATVYFEQKKKIQQILQAHLLQTQSSGTGVSEGFALYLTSKKDI